MEVDGEFRNKEVLVLHGIIEEHSSANGIGSGGFNHVYGHMMPSTASQKMVALSKKLNPDKSKEGGGTIIACVINQYWKPMQIEYARSDDDHETKKLFKDLLGTETLGHYEHQRAYRAEGELVKVGFQKKRKLCPPGQRPAPFKHEGKVEGYTKWEHAHCYTVYLDLVGYRCLLVDSLTASASGFEKKGRGNVNGSPGKPDQVNYKILVNLFSDCIPLFTDGTAKAGKAAKEMLLKNCRLVHGVEDGKKNNCVAASFAIANSFISSREDFQEVWDKAIKRDAFM